MSAALRIEPRLVTIPYRPRPLQREFHRSLRYHRADKPHKKRWSLKVCHRRWGKSVSDINHLLRAALSFPGRDGRFGYFAPLLSQAKQIAWDFLKRFSAPIPGRVVNESELRVDLPNGSRVRLYGADNPDAARGIYLDGAVLDEFGHMHRSMWGEVLRPALADREGWASVDGTPRGKNGFYDLYQQVKDDPEWYVRLWRASETGIIPPTELEALRKALSPETFEQEMECSFAAAMVGSFYARIIDGLEAQGRMKPIEWEPRLPVVTAWDLGMRDATVIWFAQSVGSEVRIIDHVRVVGGGLTHTAKLLREKPYTYGDHLLPHDIEVRELGSGVSRFETLAALGIHGRVLPRIAARVDYEEDERIEATRSLLPKCWFNTASEGVREGLEGLRAYRREENARTGELSARPVHDFASDEADAFGHLAQGLVEEFEFERPSINLRLAAPT